MNGDTYSAAGILCRRCLDMRIPEGELYAYLDTYVRELPQDEKVAPEVYSLRLKECAECKFRAEATCRLCGCYCQARAAKKRMGCPIPDQPRWTEEDIE